MVGKSGRKMNLALPSSGLGFAPAAQSAGRKVTETAKGNRAWPAARQGLSGFTLIEVMIVISIIGVLLTTAIPLVYQTLHKDPMRQAIKDVTEACNQARAMAILQGTTTELVIRPGSGTLSVDRAAQTRSTGPSAMPGDAFEAEPRPAAGPLSFAARLSEELVIEMLDVNLREFKDEEEARVRFYPNGTSDEFTFILQWQGREWQKISLEILTAIPSVEVVQ